MIRQFFIAILFLPRLLWSIPGRIAGLFRKKTRPLRLVLGGKNVRSPGVGKYSRYPGVTKNKTYWVSQIRIDGKNKHLGSFKTEKDAAKAYQAAAAQRDKAPAAPSTKLPRKKRKKEPVTPVLTVRQEVMAEEEAKRTAPKTPDVPEQLKRFHWYERRCDRSGSLQLVTDCLEDKQPTTITMDEMQDMKRSDLLALEPLPVPTNVQPLEKH